MTDVAIDPTSSDELSEQVVGSLSPSRAMDFKTCPLLYRYRTIDKIREKPSRVAARGTLVHGVLERLFDLPARQRTPHAARELLPAVWAEQVRREPRAGELFGSDTVAFGEWLNSAVPLLHNYFGLEDPSRLDPAEREQFIEVVVDGLRLRGYVDRLDVNAAGDIRVVDYKTGGAPRESSEAQALFQMKFYALVLWRTRGVVPRQLRLMYLGTSDTLTYTPDAEELERFERTVRAIWDAIEEASRAGDFRPHRNSFCRWCDHKVRCPAFGGTPPPYPGSTSQWTHAHTDEP